MDTEIITIYCLCDDFLKAMNHVEDRQRRLIDAEVMTVAIVAARYFGGIIERARVMLAEPRYMPLMVSRSRLNRRLRRVMPLLLSLFETLAEEWKAQNEASWYALDTFPVAACDPYRVIRVRLYDGEAYRGYQASKRRYYYGLKLHLMVTAHGQPVEFFLTPASCGDVTGLQLFNFDLPEGSHVYADKAYNDYRIEDELTQVGIHLLPLRKKNSKRPHPAWLTTLISAKRKVVETAGSLIQRCMPKSIHAVTAAGFEMKVVLFVLGLSLHYVLG
ncbi:transposase [Candidatus Promineifilum breve]|uniref:Transposase n=1 Tax=Candidatus Promineifilum breve TaxID=1806508 RepID=A0A160T2R6_9CHLR|nr:IS982 family transposase [Candidatus Promineifilum breve]CUS02450.2 transposase [Candidatus Promineifilum breve]CUS03549.2 transposase [Candidatus Promineifilum breve]CUS04554.2 transposase [Candidatus Promineifilum breve]CUS04913.2 transposase [Candidatus Promineifilum breve]